MLRTLLVTTSTEGLQPLGTAAQRSWELVTGQLRARLGEAHAALLSEPVPSEHGDRIDWHMPVEGEAVPLPQLEAAERAAVRARLDALVADIRAEADRLAAGADPAGRRLAEALRNAVEIPGEDMIFAVRTAAGLRPVLVHWAWLRDERRPVRGVLTGRIPRATAGGGPGEGAEEGRGGWRRWPWRWLVAVGWAVLALLLAAILYLMIAPCGLNPAGPDLCPEKGAALAAAESERAVIADRIAALERELALAMRACRPVVPLAPAPETAPGTVPETAPGAAPGSVPETEPGAGRAGDRPRTR